MIPFIRADQSKCFVTLPKVMVNGDVIFTISEGPIQIESILSECVTANNATASTMQYKSNPTLATAATISGASASLSSFALGGTVRLAPTALSTAPVLALVGAGGVHLGTNVANRIIVQKGTISVVIAVGSTTGTWKHHIRYTPLSPNSVILG
jgi:hypothetical protein